MENPVLFTLLTLFSLAFSLNLPSSFDLRTSSPGEAQLRTIYAFPNSTWVENLAVRSNGKLLVVLLSAPQIWQIDPVASNDISHAELIHTFPESLACLGIAEYAPDVFSVSVGNFSFETLQPTKGSWSVWSLDMSWTADSPSPPSARPAPKHAGPIIHKITDIPEAVFLNGATALPSATDIVLVADSAAGTIYALNTTTGAYTIAAKNPDLQPNSSAPAPIGVNGVQFRSQDPAPQPLYFTNSFRSPVLGRMSVMPASGAQDGPVDEILPHTTYPTVIGAQADDFTFDRAGHVWLTTNADNSIVRVEIPGGEAAVIAGGPNSSVLPGPTACKFGRTEWDKDILYISTNGGLIVPPPGGIVGGAVLALDTASM